MVNRALEMALSDPKGPSYLMATREVLEEVSHECLHGLTLCNVYIMFRRVWRRSGWKKSF